MLFDFRIRPPFKSFLTTGGMFGGHDGSHDPAYIDPYETGKDPIPSADKGDMDLFFQEMEANGIDKAGIIGRISLEVGWCDPSLKPDDPIIDPVYEKVNELGGITLISLSFCYGPDLS